MPSKYRIREFAEDQHYHLFNRGIQKTKIFLDDQDYQIFLYYVKVYLADPKILINKYPQLPIRLQGKNLNHVLNLIAYCFMPNHFHFLLKQSTKDAVSRFMKQLLNAYTFYFNEKYARTGPLFEGRYKAVRISSEELLLHITRYIHLNPVVSGLTNKSESYRWSSHKDYMTNLDGEIVKTKTVLNFFKTQKDFQKFVEDQVSYGKELENIKHLIID